MRSPRLCACILAAALAAGPAVLPSAAAPIVLPSLGVAGGDLPEVSERRIGEEMMRELAASPYFMDDPVCESYLSRLGNRLVSAGQPSPYSFEFHPLRVRGLNAFAMPGGFVAVNSGLVVASRSESELASVLAHEVSHVTQRHIARMVESQSGSAALSIGSALLAILAGVAGSPDAAAAIMMGGQAGLVANQLKHSRQAEREADRIGLDTLARAGFDPSGMLTFFQRLQQDNMAYETDATRYLSTHPLTVERIGDIRNRLSRYRVRPVASSTDYFLVKERLRILQEDSHQGVLDRIETVKRNLAGASGVQAGACHYGLAVAYSRLGRLPDARKEIAEAIRLIGAKNLILEKAAIDIQWRSATGSADKAKALEACREAVRRWPLSIMLVKTEVDLLQQSGWHAEAIKFILHQHAISRGSVDYFMMLARSYEALGKRSLQHQSLGEAELLKNNEKGAYYHFCLAQQAGDGDFYTLSEIDARINELRRSMNKKKR